MFQTVKKLLNITEKDEIRAIGLITIHKAKRLIVLNEEEYKNNSKMKILKQKLKDQRAEFIELKRNFSILLSIADKNGESFIDKINCIVEICEKSKDKNILWSKLLQDLINIKNNFKFLENQLINKEIQRTIHYSNKKRPIFQVYFYYYKYSKNSKNN